MTLFIKLKPSITGWLCGMDIEKCQLEQMKLANLRIKSYKMSTLVENRILYLITPPIKSTNKATKA